MYHLKVLNIFQGRKKKQQNSTNYFTLSLTCTHASTLTHLHTHTHKGRKGRIHDLFGKSLISAYLITQKVNESEFPLEALWLSADVINVHLGVKALKKLRWWLIQGVSPQGEFKKKKIQEVAENVPHVPHDSRVTHTYPKAA